MEENGMAATSLSHFVSDESSEEVKAAKQSTQQLIIN